MHIGCIHNDTHMSLGTCEQFIENTSLYSMHSHWWSFTSYCRGPVFRQPIRVSIWCYWYST